jgi:hypothetical protein
VPAAVADFAGMKRHLRLKAACGARVGAAESVVSFIPLLGGLDQHANLRYGVVKDAPWNALDPFCTSNLPVETLDLVR